MGIKTFFNPLGGRLGDKDRGDLSLWRYSNSVITRKTLLYNYTGSDWTNTIYVPKVDGKAIINDWYNDSSGGIPGKNRNTPFYNHKSVESVGLQGVPFRNDSMYYAFGYCQNLIFVNNIPNSVTNMAYTFAGCNNLNQNIKIPNSITDMYGTFHNCNNLNQNIKIPNSVTSMSYTFRDCIYLNQNIKIPNSVTGMSGTFLSCIILNQNIQIPDSVTDMGYTFAECHNLNQNIQIPNSVTSMGATFSGCTNLNQNIQIPNSVINMSETFSACYNLQGRINVLTTKLSGIRVRRTFWNTNASKSKRVYIYFNYANGVATGTYNTVVQNTNANFRWNGQNGVTVYNLGSAPW